MPTACEWYLRFGVITPITDNSIKNTNRVHNNRSNETASLYVLYLRIEKRLFRRWGKLWLLQLHHGISSCSLNLTNTCDITCDITCCVCYSVLSPLIDIKLSGCIKFNVSTVALYLIICRLIVLRCQHLVPNMPWSHWLWSGFSKIKHILTIVYLMK